MAGRRRKSGTPKRSGGKGAAKLKKAASEELDKRSGEIAEKLANLAVGGSVPIVRFLLELAEQAPESEGAGGSQLIRSLAEELAKEPQWQPAAEIETGKSDS